MSSTFIRGYSCCTRGCQAGMEGGQFYLGLLWAEKVGLDAEDLADGVQPLVLLHPLLVVGNKQAAVVDPSRINASLLRILGR